MKPQQFLLVLVISLLFGHLSFGKQKNENSSECKPITIGKLINNSPEFTGNKKKIKNALVKEWLVLVKKTATADTVYITFDASSSISYLVVEGKTDKGATIITAIELGYKSGDFILVCDKEQHTCLADNCKGCKFMRNTNGKITGCKCNTDNNICNHTIKDSYNDIYRDYNSK